MTMFPGKRPEVDESQLGLEGPGFEPVARNTDPSTSHLAAASVKDLPSGRAAVYRVLKSYGPMTDEALVSTYFHLTNGDDYPRQSGSGIRTRRKELCRTDPPLVIDTNRKTTIASGRKAILWAVSAE